VVLFLHNMCDVLSSYMARVCWSSRVEMKIQWMQFVYCVKLFVRSPPVLHQTVA